MSALTRTRTGASDLGDPHSIRLSYEGRTADRTTPAPTTLQDLPPRIAAKTSVDGGCWRWTGGHREDGYGLLSVNGRTMSVHRWSVETFVGPIGAGLSVDHLCRVRDCFNPAHLEVVTQQVNLLRGQTRAARNAAVTECAKGHAYDAANTRITSRGWRACRACARDRKRVAS